MRKFFIVISCFVFISGICLAEEQGKAPIYGKLLSNIKVSKSSFNPQKGEEIYIYFHLSKGANVEVNVHDPDFGLIRALKKDFSDAGDHEIVWDGKDMDGKVVPDEAYFFTILADDKNGNKELYDPAAFSGGEEFDITKADINPETNTINYRLPVMGRVSIRMGIQAGPLLDELVDWKPRVAGEITEYWNGKDKDNLIDLYNHPRFKMVIVYFTLPENSVIAFGNANVDYIEYKQSVSGKPAKEQKERPNVKISRHYQIPRTKDFSPHLTMSFSNVQDVDKQGIPILKEKTLVKVELDEKDKKTFANEQYEVAFFLDTEFYAEEEVGYSPYNWVWDLSQVKEGEHVLTINLSSFKDQIGILSKKVRVVK